MAAKTVRIFKPARTAMQSGTRKTRHWRLEPVVDRPPEVEPLMGWTSSVDTDRQVHLNFPTKEEAIAYAERNGFSYRVEDEKRTADKKIAYADNFRADRSSPWTH
ncbi:MAG: ETC complex I subunit [Pseudomonadota bacterium]